VIVTDASVLVAMFLRMEGADAIEARLLGSGLSAQAPHLVDAEVAHVVRRYAANRQISPERGGDLLADLVDLPLRRHAHDWLLPRVWELRHNFTAYDAVYVALAEALEAPLLTRDPRLAAAAGHHAKIELV
jgi:predicted nucleic acid-binding protein